MPAAPLALLPMQIRIGDRFVDARPANGRSSRTRPSLTAARPCTPGLNAQAIPPVRATSSGRPMTGLRFFAALQALSRRHRRHGDAPAASGRVVVDGESRRPWPS